MDLRFGTYWGELLMPTGDVFLGAWEGSIYDIAAFIQAAAPGATVQLSPIDAMSDRTIYEFPSRREVA